MFIFVSIFILMLFLCIYLYVYTYVILIYGLARELGLDKSSFGELGVRDA